jgi:L-aspartate oxidase
MDREKFINHFPNIYQKCIDEGIDPFKELIPVVPACHYLMGGIDTDKNGQSSIKNLLQLENVPIPDFTVRIVWHPILYWKVWFFGHNAAMKTVELLKKMISILII